MSHNLDIRLKLGDGWVNARDYQARVFESIDEMTSTVSFDEDGIKFEIQRCGNSTYGGLHMIKEDGNRIPISNFSPGAVKVFLLDQDPVQWYDSRMYQQWAYYHFLYSGEEKILYASRDSNCSGQSHRVVIIDLPDLVPGIIFSMSRNANGSIYYERDDTNRTRVRICDNDYARRHYLAYYHRMTEPIGFHPVSSSQQLSSSVQIPSGLVEIKTDDEDKQCHICWSLAMNVVYEPCQHSLTCHKCTQQLDKMECPFCRVSIQNMKKLN